MRNDIYYWKCDSPTPVEQKRLYNDKYAAADIAALVSDIAQAEFGKAPVSVEAAGGQGNHYTYLLRYPDRTLFFRSDDGVAEDDYMEAENAVMKLVRAHGVPVPEVFASDASKNRFPVRYQILELLTGKSLNSFYDDGTLEVDTIARELGRCMAKIHEIKLDGFGFLNTDELRKSGRMVGLDSTNSAYFYKCLDSHIKYLEDTGFLSVDQGVRVEQLFSQHESLLEIDRGSLVHKDMAMWNVIGEPGKISAIIDWDDAVIDDPVDDISILMCFYDERFLTPFLAGYKEVRTLPDDFDTRVNLYLARNMLWKSVIRSYMGYFDMSGDFFLLGKTDGGALKERTYAKLFGALDAME